MYLNNQITSKNDCQVARKGYQHIRKLNETDKKQCHCFPEQNQRSEIA
jgi:hypothetical protein